MSTHIGDAWRAAGLLPIAMVVQCTGSIAPGPGRISDFRHRLIAHHGVPDQPRPAGAADRVVVHERGHHRDSRLVDTAREPFDALVAAPPGDGHPDEETGPHRRQAGNRHDGRSNPGSEGRAGVSPDRDGQDHEPHGRGGGHQDQSRERNTQPEAVEKRTSRQEQGPADDRRHPGGHDDACKSRPAVTPTRGRRTSSRRNP